MGLVIRQLAYDSPEAIALTDAVQAEYVVRYGEVDETPVVAPEFAPPSGEFLVAFLDGQPLGCGGFRTVAAGVCEMKRLYVAPAARGRGVARGLLAALEQRAAAAGCHQLVLETGSKQPEALALYASSGYTPVPAFGTYACAPGASHLGKYLGVAAVDPGVSESTAPVRASG